MIFKPWDCAQPDEWLPQSLRLCWGGDGGGSGPGGGESGGGGGWGGDAGFSATTGGGDWGSAGSYDASGFNAGGDLGAWAGTAYDASTAGTGMGGGGDWGSFGDTNFAGMNAPNPTYADVAGPNPGVTTGGGDWGSAGITSFTGTGGAPGGGFWGDSGVGTAYGGGGGGGGGGFWGDTGGGGGGYYGGGGQQGGGSFGSFGSGTLGGSNMVSSVSGPAFADTAGSAGGHASAGPSGGGSHSMGGQAAAAAGKGSEAAPDAGPEAGPAAAPDADPDAAPAPAQSDFGKPAEPDAAPAAAPEGKSEAGPEAAPAISSTIAGGRETNFDYGPQAAPAQPEAQPSHFGPQTVAPDYQGAPYSSNYDQAPPSQAYQQATQQLSDLTQSALAPQPDTTPWGSVFEAPAQAPNYEAVFEAPAQAPADVGKWSDLPGVYSKGISDTLSNMFPTGIDLSVLANPSTWLSPKNQQTWSEISNLPNTLNPNNWVDINSPMGPAWGPQSTAFDLQALGEQGKAGQQMDLASQLGWQDISPTQGLDPGSQQYGTEAYAPGGVDPSAEQYGVETGINPGAEQYGIEAAQPGIEAFIPGGRETNFEGERGNIEAFIPAARETDFNYGPAPVADQPAPEGQPGQPPTTDDASTPGGDPSLSGGAANAPQGQPATAPAQGGQTFVTDAAVNATVNAVSVALDKAGVSPITQDAVTQAVYDAALNLASPADQANAAANAALQTGASPAQAAAIANATYNAAMAQPAFTPGQPGQQQQAPPGPEQPGAPEGEQTTSTTSAFIPGGLQTNFEYPSSQPAPQSLIDMAQPQPGTPLSFPGTPTTALPPAVPQPQPGQPGEPDHDEEPDTTTPAPGRPLAPPTSRTQNTPVNTARVRQEQGGGWRSRPVNEALHGILTRAAEHADVVVRVGSGGQVATRSRADYRQPGGWTGSVRHNHGNAADVRLEKDGRILSYNNPQDRAVMEAFVREAARLGATGQGAGMRYMGPNTIHVGFGGTNFWNADNPGSRALQQAWREGLQGPANRPPADIPVRQAQAIPLPRRRPEDAAQPDVPPAAPPQPEVAQPQPPTDIPVPTALPPQAPQETRPPADILPPTLTPPRAGRAEPMLQARFANDLLKDATKNLNKNSGEAEFQAASVVGAKALAAAGIPLDMARSLMSKGAYEGATKNGYDINSWPMGGMYKSKIDAGIDAALQGYQPARPGAVQGPPSPFAPEAAVPGKRSDVGNPLLHFVAGGRDVGAPPAIGSEFGPGRAEWESLSPGPRMGSDPNVVIEGPEFSPPAPPPALRGPDPEGRGRVFDPDIFPFRMQEQDLQQQLFDPRGWQQAGLMGLLQNFNPISTAEARGRGRGASYPVPPGSTRSNPHFTFYGPGPGGRMEGGFETSRPNQAGTNVPITLDMVRSAREQGRDLDVTLASDPSRYGDTINVGTVTYVSPIDGKQYTLDNVRGFVHDTGSAFKGRPEKVDIAVSDYTGWSERAAGDQTALAHIGAAPNAIVVTGPGDQGTAVGAGPPADAPPAASPMAFSPGSRPTAPPLGPTELGQAPPAPPYGLMDPNSIGAQGIPSLLGLPSQPGAFMDAYGQVYGPRGLAKGGHVAKDEPVVVGEEGPETFVPDTAGTVWPHMPQSGKTGKTENIDRWPKLPAPNFPGRYGGVEREMLRQTREAQNPVPSLMDLVDSGRLPLNAANWHAMLNDPSLIALGRSRMGTVDAPAPEPAAEPPDPANPMAQALGYGSIRRPMRIGRQIY